MSRQAIAGIIVALLIIIGLGGWYIATHQTAQQSPSSSTSSSSSNSSMPNMSTGQQPSSSSSNQPATAASAVTIQNFAFSPASITVKKGTTVTWTNNDSVAHTITENDGKTGPDSSLINPGSTYTFTYNTAGTFQYHCSIHPEMTGSVTVTE